MANNTKDFIFNLIFLISIFNFVLLIISPIAFEHFTGNTVLKGEIKPGETFEGEFNLVDSKEISIFFRAKTSSIVSKSENLEISISDSNGLLFSKIKKFTIRSSESGTTSSLSDYLTFIPRITGTHYILVTNAEFPTDIEIKSGAYNIQYDKLFITVLVLSILILVILIFIFKRTLYSVSKLEVLIAFMISSTIIYFAIS
ncbi:MAG: hypothetical protein HF975_14750 [ANME-2 cluster archaeon]|nr:hypothetical protein [ANME-2 cluster archaeon]MBC2748228.1 hypothetical protein [ANME-2 cluster archaeon]